MRKITGSGLVVLMSCLLLGCPAEKQAPEVGFYYWKSTFRLSPAEQSILARNQVRRIYTKFLDVDIEQGQPVPKAPIRFEGATYQQFEIVPCIFITNRTFKAGVDPVELAQRVWAYLQEINTTYELVPKAYQLDCDWSLRTRSAYFTFLRAFRRQAGDCQITATIRLHQLQYASQTGVPPVDRGVLMYYNMGNIQSVEEPNSILNHETAATYLAATASYALPLDYALPVFSWVLAYRLGELHAIINQSPCTALDTLAAAEKLLANRYRMQRNAYFGNHYLNRGDQLRCESVSKYDLAEAIDQLKSLDNDCEQLLFYHLDESNFHEFSQDLPLRLADRLVLPQ